MNLVPVSEENLTELLEVLKEEERQDPNLAQYNFSKDLESLPKSHFQYLHTIKNISCIAYYPLNDFQSFTWVSKKYRGRGYGKALILGLNRDTVISTSSSYSFYTKIGFDIFCVGCQGKCRGEKCEYIFKPNPKDGPVTMKKF